MYEKTFSSQQLSFPFVWPAHVHATLADKHMLKRRDCWGEIEVHRNTCVGIWVVSKWIPVIGPSGRIGAAMYYVFPQLMFSGQEAHDFAGRLKQNSGPFIDQTEH